MQVVILLLIVVLILLWIHYRWTNRHIFKALKDIPDPFPYSFIGIGYKLAGKSIDEIYDAIEPIIQKYDTWKCWLGPMCHVVLRKPEDVKIVLSSKDCLEKHTVYNFLFPKTGIVTAEAKIWKQHRKLLNPVFSQSQVLSFIPTFNKQSNILIECLRKKIGKKEFDILEFISKCTMDMIGATTMGLELKCQNNENSNYLEAREIYPSLVVNRVLRLWQHPDFLYKFTKAYKLEDKAVRTICDLSAKVIREKEINRNENEIKIKEQQIFLEHVLQLKDSKQFTDRDVRDEVDTILIAVSNLII